MSLKAGASALAICAVSIVVAQTLPLPEKPRIGIRASLGNWDRTMVGLGADVTFRIPFAPLPAIRVDGEVWGNPSDFGKGKRGNAISVLGVKSFPLSYAGIGPTFWFTSKDGDHSSGLGLKVLVGADLPNSMYVEGSAIFGPSPAAFFISFGFKF